MSTRTLVSLGVAAFLFAGCPKSDDNPLAPEGGAGSTPQTAVPEEFVGTWYNGSVSLSNFYNSSTGEWTNAVGSGSFYRFFQDGTFEFGWQMHVSLYGCSNTGMVYRRGTVAARDSILVLYDRFSRVMGQDNCNASQNYEKAGTISTETLVIQPGRDEWGNPGLYIRGPNTTYSWFLLER
jgi:hypothetical protein